MKVHRLRTIGDAIDWIGDGISSLWDSTVGPAVDEIWDIMFSWLFNLIYGAIADLFEFINESTFVFFHVEPTNISVLSADNIDAKVHHLMMLLSMITELEIIALDSCECLDTNKSYVRKRLKDEPNEAVRDMLSADYSFLDDIQVKMSSARQFSRLAFSCDAVKISTFFVVLENIQNKGWNRHSAYQSLLFGVPIIICDFAFLLTR